MRIALERRKKALEAVLLVESLMARAQPGVDLAVSTLSDVSDVSRQINRDHTGAMEVLSKASAAVAKDSKDVADAASSLAKLQADPRLAALGDEATTAALAAAAEVCPQPSLRT